MKIKLTIIALILSCTIQAQDFFTTNLWKFTYFSGIAAILSVPAYEHYWYELDKNTNGFTISSGVDPNMLAQGMLDFRQKFYYHYKRFEPNLVIEQFDYMAYTGVGAGLDYMIINHKLGFLAGAETTRIWNQNQIVQSVGCNLEARLLMNDRLSYSIVGNWKTRPELTEKESVISIYLHVNYKLIKN